VISGRWGLAVAGALVAGGLAAAERWSRGLAVAGGRAAGVVDRPRWDLYETTNRDLLV
jgi:hypothetical protein